MTLAIQDLPPKVLTCLFHHLAEQASTTIYHWIPAATHVCKQWRTVALTTPRLWTTVHTGVNFPVGLIEELLKRSKPLPITVVHHFPTLKYEDLSVYGIDKVILHSDRFRNLDFIGTRAWQRELLQAVIGSASYPAVESISCDDFTLSKARGHIPYMVSQAARLSQLSINCPSSNLSTVLPLPLNSTLSSLSISTKMDVGMVLGTLSNCPNLSSVVLDGITQLTSAHLQSLPEPTLERLEILRLKGDAESCVKTLENLRIPIEASIHVLPTSRHSFNIFRKLVDFVKAKISNEQSPAKLLSFSIETIANDQTHLLSCWTEPLPSIHLVQGALNCDLRPKVLLSLPSQGDLDDAFNYVYTTLNLETAQTLFLKGTNQRGLRDQNIVLFRSILHQSLELRSLVFFDWNAESVASFLQPEVDDLHVFPRLFLPALEEFSAWNMTWRSPWETHLSGVLQRRARTGIPVKKVALRQSQGMMDHADVRELLQFVETVELGDAYPEPVEHTFGASDSEDYIGDDLEPGFEFEFDEDGTMI